MNYIEWAAQETNAVVLFIHGMGAHGQRWNDLAEILKESNVSSFAFDLQGFGDTKGRRGDIKSFDEYTKFIGELYKVISQKYIRVPIFICGESMGGVIAINAALQMSKSFAGLIAVSPAFKGRLKFSLLQYVGIGLSLLLYPKKLFHVPFSSQMCTQDTEYLDKMEADKREHRLASARFLFNFLNLQKRVVKSAPNLDIPVLFLSPEIDTVVDSNVTKEVFEKLDPNKKQIKIYKDMYHALTIDVNRHQVFVDIKSWIKEKL